MKNLKIRYKLLSLSLILILSLLVTSIASLLFMAKINDEMDRVNVNWVPSVIIAEEINTEMANFRIAENGHVIAQDQQTMTIYENNLDKAQESMESMIEEYTNKYITNETDKKIIGEISDIWTTYKQLHNKMIGYSMNNDTDAAYAMLRGDSLAVFDQMKETCHELVELNKTGVENAAVDGYNVYIGALIFMIVMILVVTIASFIFANYIINLIVKPINEIENTASQMLLGDLNNHINYTSKDELGLLANSVRELCKMIKLIIGDTDEKLTRFANKDLRPLEKIKDCYVGDFKNLYTNMQKIQASLADTLKHLDNVASQLADGSGQVAQGASGVADGGMNQSSSIQNLSAAMQEMTAKITQTANDTGEAKTFNSKSQNALLKSNEQVESMIKAMKDISKNADEIKKIIQDIDDIAFQTNILSLNAAVEAARAGESGKGFAVVADEVRNLARKSAQSAKDTADLIAKTVEVVSVGNSIAGSTSDSIGLAISNATKLSNLVDNIADASKDQADNANHINSEIEQIANVVASNSVLADDSAQASEQLSEQSIVLKKLIGEFKVS
ncbi:MAG: hypothetical protein ATN31_02935 [Candidatus Epulonipiscioides saccharophilum]|nr:MAG: hypothetical protein ATN31_02935 [Epulopiscium sp. AS2M-Bin001]